MAKKVKITLKRSIIGRRPEQRATVKALGLRKLHHSVEKVLNPSVEGMINKVTHLIEVEEI